MGAAIAHAGTVFAWFLAPLLVYMVKRGESKYVEFHAMQALLWSLFEVSEPSVCRSPKSGG